MDALANAFADLDSMRLSAAKAVSDAGAVLTAGPAGLFTPPSVTRAQEQYRHNSNWPFVATRAIANRVASQDLCVGRIVARPRKGQKLTLPSSFKSIGTRIEPILDQELLRAFASPNDVLTRWALLHVTTSSLMLTGAAYWWLSDPKNVWYIPASWLEPSDRMRSSWKLRPPGLVEPVDIPANDIVPFCFPNPADPFQPISPLQAQAKSIGIDEEILQSQYRAFRNGVHPSVMVRVGKIPGAVGDERPVLTSEQRIELIEAIKRLYAGSHRNGEPLIVDGLIEGVDKLSHSVEEMDFLQSSNSVRDRILQSFGVSGYIVGASEPGSRAASYVADEHFCSNVCNPIIECLSQSLTQAVQRRYGSGLVAWFDPCKAHDAEMSLQEWQTGLQFGVVTGNEYRTQVLNIDSRPELDILRNPLGYPVEDEHLEPSRNGRY